MVSWRHLSVQAPEILCTTSLTTQCSPDSDSGVPLVGEETLVPASSRPLASGGSGSGPSQPGVPRSLAVDSGSGVPSEPRNPAARGPVIRTALESRGWSAGSISVAEGALRVSSIELYAGHWHELVEWITAKGSSPSAASLALVVDFLRFLHEDRHLVLSTIRSYVSAIHYPLRLLKGCDIFDDPSYAVFMKA